MTFIYSGSEVPFYPVLFYTPGSPREPAHAVYSPAPAGAGPRPIQVGPAGPASRYSHPRGATPKPERSDTNHTAEALTSTAAPLADHDHAEIVAPTATTHQPLLFPRAGSIDPHLGTTQACASSAAASCSCRPQPTGARAGTALPRRAFAAPRRHRHVRCSSSVSTRGVPRARTRSSNHASLEPAFWSPAHER